MTLRRFVLYPFLFCLYPVLFLWSKNLESVPFSFVIPPLIVSFVLTAIFFLIFSRIFKDYIKSGVILFILLVFFFSYGHVYNILQGVTIGGIEIYRHRYLVIIWPLLALLLSSICLASPKQVLSALNAFLNIACLILIISPLMGILSFEFNNITQKNDPVLLANSRTTETINNSDPAGNNSLPDIYYIILDAYGQADILKDEIGYNNSQFLDSLKARRFYVAEKSRSNYAWTMLSIPSALNMRYLNKDNISFGLNDPEVIRILRGKGYKIISLPSSGFYSVNINSDDEYIERRPCCFLPDLIETTWLYPLESLGAVNFIFNAKRQGILYQFETLGSIPRMKGAKFIYAHIFITHPPYVFNDDGSPLILSLPELFKPKNRSSNFWHNLEGIIYAKQLIFANKKIIELVDKIILESRIPPIIIIQGDHGPLLGYPPKPVTDFLLRQRMGILNAYYLPSKGKKYLYNNISPVNTFRLVFNTSFDMKYDLLPDISYYSTGEEGTSDFIRVPDEE